MATISATLLRVERAVRAMRIAAELVDDPVPSAALRQRADLAVAEILRRDAGRAVKAALAVFSAASAAAPAACAARATWIHQESGAWRPLVFCGIALGGPAAAPRVAAVAGLADMSAGASRGAVDGAAWATLSSLRVLPGPAAGAAALAGAAVRVRGGASPSDVLAGLALGWLWARAAAAVVRPLHDNTPVAEPVEISEYREKRRAH